jgi:tetratricopeptide (TPR) repeat protein
LAALTAKTSDLQGIGRVKLLLGRVLVQQGKLDQAQPELKEALRLIRESVLRGDSLTAQASNWLGAIQMARKDYPGAERLMLPDVTQFFTPAAQMSPNEQRLAVGNLIALYRAWGKPEQEAVWQKKLDSIPDVASAWSLRVVANADAKPEEIERQYRDVLTKQRSILGYDNSTVLGTLCELAAFLKSQGRPEEAARLYRESLGLGSNFSDEELLKLPAALEKLAAKLLASGKRQDVEKLFEDAIEFVRRALGESHPAVGLLRDDLSNLLAGEGKYDAAADQLLQAAQGRRARKDDDLVRTLYQLGRFQLSAGRSKDAETTTREALELFSSLRLRGESQSKAKLAMALADALLQGNKLPEAEHFCREAITTVAAGQWREKEQYYFQANLWLIRVLKTESKLAEAQAVLDKMLSRVRRITVATALITEAFPIDPRRPNDAETRAFFLHCGMEVLRDVPPEDVFKAMPVLSGLMDHGYKQETTNICWRILDSSTTDAGWFNRAAWYFATTESPSNRDPVLAVELAKRSIKLDENRETWNTLGVARFRAGDFKQAITDLEKCESVSVPPNVGSSFNYFFMAMAHHHLGNADAARRCYDQAITWMEENRPQDPELLRFRAEAETLLGSKVQAKAQIPTPAQ